MFLVFMIPAVQPPQLILSPLSFISGFVYQIMTIENKYGRNALQMFYKVL